jgi:ubiquinone/menaquinone biosynthesis C-methylase UbiE
MTDSTRRFSNRVKNYVRYRPSYPQGVISALQAETALTKSSVIADIGSGTGLSAELFLQNGNPVFGVEPNLAMRQAAEQHLKNYPHFYSVDGTAEATTLPNKSVDYAVAAQAFHWFNPQLARQEFSRILQPGGWVVLI